MKTKALKLEHWPAMVDNLDSGVTRSWSHLIIGYGLPISLCHVGLSDANHDDDVPYQPNLPCSLLTHSAMVDRVEKLEFWVKRRDNDAACWKRIV